MGFIDILLILLSGAGLLHGIFFAVYLIFFQKKKTTANVLLGGILIFMAFRIGKSVLLYFGSDLEPQFIFAGLSFLLIIGPLLRSYVRAMTLVHFTFQKFFLEVLPFVLVFIMSFFVGNNWLDKTNREHIIIFGSTIIFIYLHLAFYIFQSSRVVWQLGKAYPAAQRTKSQTTILQWLQKLLIGFMVIWVSYVLNLIEDTVPYIVGPIVYSLVIYYLSYQAYTLKAAHNNGDGFSKNNKAVLFDRITKLVIEQKMYLEPDVSLASISKLVQKSVQATSEAINQNAKQNFNDFINYYRIQDAKKRLLAVNAKKYTISSIAFDTGFSSLSSFNTAFKKFVGKTPSSYRDTASKN